jgi:hypothetical protein
VTPNKLRRKGKGGEIDNKIKLTVERYGSEGNSEAMHRVVGGDPNYEGRWAKGLDYAGASGKVQKETNNEIEATQWVRIFHCSGNYSDHCLFSMTQGFS